MIILSLLRPLIDYCVVLLKKFLVFDLPVDSVTNNFFIFVDNLHHLLLSLAYPEIESNLLALKCIHSFLQFMDLCWIAASFDFLADYDHLPCD